jgi:hypothetical protein
MKKNIAFMIQMAILLLPVATASDGTEQERSPNKMVKHSYLCSDIGAKRVFKISAAGKIEWEYPADQCTDAWMLDNGNILMSFTGKTRGVREPPPIRK